MTHLVPKGNHFAWCKEAYRTRLERRVGWTCHCEYVRYWTAQAKMRPPTARP